VTTSSTPCSFFSLFGDLMPKEEKNYQSNYVFVHHFIWIWHERHYLVCVGRVDTCFKNLVVCL
jgi:hypothetical protein